MDALLKPWEKLLREAVIMKSRTELQDTPNCMRQEVKTGRIESYQS